MVGKTISAIVVIVVTFVTHYFPLIAQPGGREDAFGCHAVHQRIAGIKFSPEELAYARAALERSDTFNILEYRIHLTVTEFQSAFLFGFTEIDFIPLLDSLNYINLDLERLIVDSILYEGNRLEFSHTGPLLKVIFEETLSLGDTISIKVFYKGVPMTSASGFGGFYFEGGYAYNLGIGLRDKPHNYGRAWFPCFDNFVERSTYEYHITHRPNHMAYCVGTYLGTDTLPSGLLRTSYRMNQPIPTYLSSIAVSDYVHMDFNHQGAYGIVPVRLISRPNDLANFESSFQEIGDAIDVFEKWYGPYQFERVGYVITTRGAMEHPTNVAYPASAIQNGQADNRLMAHELCHHWWGNIVTLSTSHNMWIKEGPAEYGAHLFTEYTRGKEAFVQQLKANALNVIRRAHLDDGDFLALSPMPEDKTYGTHTYRKGAMVLHNLRNYLGDEVFSESMKSILETYKYQSIDAYTMRDHLSQVSGYDLTAFFDDWIFKPGYPTFELDSFKYQFNPETQSFSLTLHIEQKLYGRLADDWFEKVPLAISFRDEHFQEIHSFTTEVGGQFSTINIEADKLPKYVLLNPDQELNLAFFANDQTYQSEGNFVDQPSLFRFRYLSGQSPARVYVEHHFAGADDFKQPNEDVRIGKKRHWKVKYADIPADIDYFVELEYTKFSGLDDDLVHTTEDSIILIWRPDPSQEWVEHPNYTKRRLIANDGQGFMRIFDLLPGEYAFANGEFLQVNNKNLSTEQYLTIFPNPSPGNLYIDAPADFDKAQIKVLNTDGKLVFHANTETSMGEPFWVNLNHLSPGTYVIEISNAANPQQVFKSSKWIKY